MTQSLAEMLSAVDVIDLTQPLSENTPVLKLPPSWFMQIFKVFPSMS